MNKSNILHPFTWAVALMVIFSSCQFGSDQRSDHQLVIPAENDIQTLSPIGLSDPFTSRIVWQIYEGLLGLDEKGDPEPMIAESWSSNDDLSVWTFELRPDVYFHPDPIFDTEDSTRAVTSTDVKKSYTYFAGGFGSFVFSGLVEGFDAFVAGEQDSITGFEAVDDKTFRVHLSRSDPSFIYRITSPYLAIMPYEVLEQNPGEIGESVNTGTGPFTLQRRTATEVYLTRNEDYWKDTDGNIEQIVFRVEKNQQLRLTQFVNGQYSMMQLPVALVPEFLSNGMLQERYANRFSTHSTTTYNVHYLGINNLALDDVHLRRAMAYAIDKGEIIDKLLYSNAVAASSPALPGMLGYEPPAGTEFDLERAQAELEQSNYDGSRIRLFVSDAPNSEQIGQVLQSDMSAAGINIELERLDFNTLITRLFSEDRPDLFLMFSEWVFSAPELLLDSYNSEKFPNPNLFGYENSRVDDLLSSIRDLSEREAINRVNYQVETIASEEVPAIWLFHQENMYVLKSNLKGFSVNKHNHWNLSGVYVD